MSRTAVELSVEGERLLAVASAEIVACRIRLLGANGSDRRIRLLGAGATFVPGRSDGRFQRR